MAAWFRRPKGPLKKQEKRDVPRDVFDKCPGCGEILYSENLAKNLGVCPTCGHHTRVTAERYLDLILDSGSFQEWDADLRSDDPLHFTDLKPYGERLVAAERKVGRSDAVITGAGRLDGRDVIVAVMDFRFIGGSMGSVVGEKIARAGRGALERRQPLLVLSASGGARMQEGIFSLMQMAKTSAVLARLHDAGIPFISILTDPTTGGVTASFAMLGDIILAEPGALIGFAGPRVIEETIRQELPEGFQRSEFLLTHGMVDRVVDRRELKASLGRLLAHLLGPVARVRSGPHSLGASVPG
ncbi:MAG: acetyl-CoA carboxylase, carboxyltransferase subunit beta [Gemmatimonadota bacterium]